MKSVSPRLSLFLPCLSLLLGGYLLFPARATPQSRSAGPKPVQTAGGGLSRSPVPILPDAKPGKRLLKFPTDKSYGSLIVLPSFSHGQEVPQKAILMARGTVSLPHNKFVLFRPGENFFRNPSVLDTFAPDSFDGLDIKFLSMADDEDKLCDQALAHCEHLTGLKVLLLDKADVSDAGLSHLSTLVNLEFISAFLAQIDGTCFKDLSTLKKLDTLSIPSVGLKNETLRYLPKLTGLRNLDLSRAGLNDEGMKYIGQCSKLKRLFIQRNPHITDASVKYIAQLKELVVLDLREASISVRSLTLLKDLKLSLFCVPMTRPGATDTAFLQKTFPTAELYFADRGKAKIDDETSAIFSQVSRDRKF